MSVSRVQSLLARIELDQVAFSTDQNAFMTMQFGARKLQIKKAGPVGATVLEVLIG